MFPLVLTVINVQVALREEKTIYLLYEEDSTATVGGNVDNKSCPSVFLGGTDELGDDSSSLEDVRSNIEVGSRKYAADKGVEVQNGKDGDVSVLWVIEEVSRNGILGVQDYRYWIAVDLALRFLVVRFSLEFSILVFGFLFILKSINDSVKARRRGSLGNVKQAKRPDLLCAFWCNLKSLMERLSRIYTREVDTGREHDHAIDNDPSVILEIDSVVIRHFDLGEERHAKPGNGGTGDRCEAAVVLGIRVPIVSWSSASVPLKPLCNRDAVDVLDRGGLIAGERGVIVEKV